jgi:NAD(P)-dependent dehydrogenase (short-subunit alcohol dehydrogenase family)
MTALDGKVAVVTGAARGIGRQVAIDLAADGATVVLASRSVDPKGKLPGTLGEVAEAVEATGGTALVVPTDLSDFEQVDRLARRTLDELGRVDILVNNAAYTGRALTLGLSEITREQWLMQFAVNVHAPYFLTQAFVGSMREHGGGRVINVSSGAANFETPTAGASSHVLRPKAGYGSTKAALNRMTNSLAQELFDDGIVVVAVEPGKVLTEVMVIMGERGGDISDAIPTSVPAGVIHHLATAVDAMRHTGALIHAPSFAETLGPR